MQAKPALLPLLCCSEAAAVPQLLRCLLAASCRVLCGPGLGEPLAEPVLLPNPLLHDLARPAAAAAGWKTSAGQARVLGEPLAGPVLLPGALLRDAAYELRPLVLQHRVGHRLCAC